MVNCFKLCNLSVLNKWLFFIQCYRRNKTHFHVWLKTPISWTCKGNSIVYEILKVQKKSSLLWSYKKFCRILDIPHPTICSTAQSEILALTWPCLTWTQEIKCRPSLSWITNRKFSLRLAHGQVGCRLRAWPGPLQISNWNSSFQNRISL